MAFGALLLLGLVAGIIWYSLSSAQYATFEIRTSDSVSGLIADAPVEFHGVEVGKVKSVELQDPRSVGIILSVRRTAPVTQATVATVTARGLATRGFTGYVYIALDDVGTEYRPLTTQSGHRFPMIPTAPGRSFDLDKTLSDVKQNVQQLTDLVHSVLDMQTVASLKSSIDNLQKVTQTLRANNERLETIIHNTERTSRNAERASNRIIPLLESSESTIRTLQAEVLPNADDTLARLQDLSATLTKITAEIERDPSVLVRGRTPPPPGPGEKK